MKKNPHLTTVKTEIITPTEECDNLFQSYLVAEMNGSSSKMTKNISTYKNVATKVHCKLILIRILLHLKHENSEHDTNNTLHRKKLTTVELKRLLKNNEFEKYTQ